MDYLRETLHIYRMELQAGRKIEDADKDAIRSIEKWCDDQMKPDLHEPKYSICGIHSIKNKDCKMCNSYAEPLHELKCKWEDFPGPSNPTQDSKMKPSPEPKFIDSHSCDNCIHRKTCTTDCKSYGCSIYEPEPSPMETCEHEAYPHLVCVKCGALVDNKYDATKPDKAPTEPKEMQLGGYCVTCLRNGYGMLAIGKCKCQTSEPKSFQELGITTTPLPKPSPEPKCNCGGSHCLLCHPDPANYPRCKYSGDCKKEHKIHQDTDRGMDNPKKGLPICPCRDYEPSPEPSGMGHTGKCQDGCQCDVARMGKPSPVGDETLERLVRNEISMRMALNEWDAQMQYSDKAQKWGEYLCGYVSEVVRAYLLEGLPHEALFGHNTWTKEECDKWNACLKEIKERWKVV